MITKASKQWGKKKPKTYLKNLEDKIRLQKPTKDSLIQNSSQHCKPKNNERKTSKLCSFEKAMNHKNRRHRKLKRTKQQSGHFFETLRKVDEMRILDLLGHSLKNDLERDRREGKRRE